MSQPILNADPAAVSSEEFFKRSRSRLSFAVPPALTDPSIIPASGDPDVDEWLREVAREKPVRPAAVLIGVVDHAGQIAFPGGKIDATDASPVEAALREAEEEIGLNRSFVDPLGYLDVYATPFGFRILPMVARVRPGFELNINHGEVADAFEVPLSFLMDPINHQLRSGELRGKPRSFYAMPFEERNIWGATAGILRRLYERLCGP